MTTTTTTEAFLADVLPKLIAADTALHDGDPSLRIALWSHAEPVTLFGAATTNKGWGEIGKTFEWLGGRFSDCTSYDVEVVAAGVSGDLGYVVAIERTTASVAGAAASYALRVTTVLRREEGSWKVVHRHGDPYEPETAEVVARLKT